MVLETCGISVGSVGGVLGPYHHQHLHGGINENNNMSPYAGDYAPQHHQHQQQEQHPPNTNDNNTTNNHYNYTDLDNTGLYTINNNNWQGKYRSFIEIQCHRMFFVFTINDFFFEYFFHKVCVCYA